MRRKEKIADLADKFLETRLEKSLAEVENYSLVNKKDIKEKFIEDLDTLIELAKNQQKEGIKRAIAYMNICFLRSGVFVESNPFMVSLYDDKFYLDKTETRIYFDLDFIFEPVNRDIEELTKEIKIYPTLKKFEIKELKIFYTQLFLVYCITTLEELCRYIKEKVNFDGLNLTEDFKIIYGEHMEEGVAV